MKLYVLPRLQKWSSLEIANLNYLLKYEDMEKMGLIGFLPVFKTEKQFENEYPNEKPIILETVEEFI